MVGLVVAAGRLLKNCSSFEGQSFFMCPVAEHSKHLPAFGVDPHSCKNWHSAPRRQPESLFANHLQGFAEVEVEVEAAGGLAFAFAPGSTSPVACIPFTFAVLSAWPPRLASALVEVAAVDLAELVESPSASANRCLWSARIVSSVGFVSNFNEFLNNEVLNAASWLESRTFFMMAMRALANIVGSGIVTPTSAALLYQRSHVLSDSAALPA